MTARCLFVPMMARLKSQKWQKSPFIVLPHFIPSAIYCCVEFPCVSLVGYYWIKRVKYGMWGVIRSYSISVHESCEFRELWSLPRVFGWRSVYFSQHSRTWNPCRGDHRGRVRCRVLLLLFFYCILLVSVYILYVVIVITITRSY